MYTFKYGDISTLTLDERITTPSIHIQKGDNNWYVPLFEGDKDSVVQSGDYNYTLGGIKVGNFRVAISREKGQKEDLFIIADNFYTFDDGVLNCADSPTIIESDISEVGKSGLFYAFYGCTGLTGSITFPNLTSIGVEGLYYAFCDCTGLKEVHFKSSLSGNSQCTASNMGCSNATVYFDL